ncbi:hypothetical protein KA005_67625, partial [bacterium]|nr:hypothetical protein [bacterium]
MNSNRYCIQLYIENKVGCTDRLKWTDYKHSVEELILDNKDKENLSELCHSDAVSYLQKSLISYAEAIYGLRRNRSSWATVKLYYSVFYSIRADILLSNHFIVRCKGYYYSKIKKNEKLKKFTVRKGGGDHQLSILFSNKLHKSGVNTDPLQDGNIDDMIPYFWLMKQREKINYTQKEFTDPNIVSWLQKPLSYFTENKEQDLLEMYDKADDYLYCFDKDHACLAIP